jgi:protein KRI1
VCVADNVQKYTLADHHRAALLSGRADDEDEDEQEPLTHVESQYRLRNEAVSAFKSLADESEEEDAEGGLVKREKEEKEVDLDDEEYRRFLLEMGGGEDEVRKILGIGENPVNTVRIEEDEIEEAEPVQVEGKKKKKVKSEKSREKKAKQDDDFLME